MDVRGSTVLGHPFTVASEDNVDCLSPMFFGVSCAFFALRLLPDPVICENDVRWLEIRNRMLKGSAHLLGLLIWRVRGEGGGDAIIRGDDELRQKLDKMQKVVEELKKRRSEEARANERVMSIVASREQSWFDERRQLRQQIANLVKELGAVKSKGEELVYELRGKLTESEAIVQSKERAIEEGELQRRELKERLTRAETAIDELRETHSGEILKHKTAFIELVSNQRQLEAEMGRAVRQIDSVVKQKDQSVLMVQRLSTELVKMRRDLEQKDRIMSGMIRRAGVEKKMFWKEMKPSKSKRKQADLDRHRHPLRNMSSHADAKLGGKGLCSRAVMSMNAGNVRMVKGDNHCTYEQPEFRKRLEIYSLASDSYSTEGADELLSGAERLENWVDAEAEAETETEACNITMEQTDSQEVDAFVEQLRLKDKNLEALRWRLLSAELESKRLQSHIERLDCAVMQLRQENAKLETLLIDRKAELDSLKKQLVLQFNLPNIQKLNFNSSSPEADGNHDTVWSEVKVVKKRPAHKRQETKDIGEDIVPPVESEKEKEILSKEIQDRKGDASGPSHLRHESNESDDAVNTVSLASSGEGSSKKSSWKTDIHALRVSYKIKRLKQQFLMLERMAGKQESCEDDNNNSTYSSTKGFYTLTSLLNKQVERYQSLQAKTDDICQRMVYNSHHHPKEPTIFSSSTN